MSHTIGELAELMRGRRFSVLTGAGCSTESGIPDYRGPKTRKKTRQPIQYLDFLKTPSTRQRYWARSVLGWERFRQAVPNAGHKALAELERLGLTAGLITQNVDRLHHKAGSEQVIELHGALAEVKCLECDDVETRGELQNRLMKLNPYWQSPPSAVIAPDGDAIVDPATVNDFVIAGCMNCGGVLKPDVVFFGENVPKLRVAEAFRWVENSEGLLVIGSSLTVYSGYRFVKRPHEQGLPIGMINLGKPTRGIAELRQFVDGKSGQLLPQLVRTLTMGLQFG